MHNCRCFKYPFMILSCAIFLLCVTPPLAAQICGDADCDGYLDIGDLNAAMAYFALGGNMPACYDNMEFDGHANVNIGDFLDFLCFAQSIHLPEFTCDHCFPLHESVAPIEVPGNQAAISPSSYPANFTGPLEVVLSIRFTGQIRAFAVPFRVRIGTQEALIVPGSITTYGKPPFDYLPLRVSGNDVLAQGATMGGADAGTYRILKFRITGPLLPSLDPAPLTLELIPYPADLNPHTGEPANYPLFIGQNGYVLPTVAPSFPCCQGQTGNADCDALDAIDIADISAMIDYLYISFTPLCCVTAANTDGSIDGKVDISDLTALIDFEYITFTPLAPCQ
jgi:hypothetical protein